MVSNSKNFCGGNFDDWVEVMLTPDCNGSCKWCVDKTGWHPKEQACVDDIAKAILRTGRENVILLGGEPTLYPDLCSLISQLKRNKRKVYLTTNGSRISHEFIYNNFRDLDGLNISIHHYDLAVNRDITGIDIEVFRLQNTIAFLEAKGVNVRLNCNLIKGYIDSQSQIEKYVVWAKALGVSSIRFAELKGDPDLFVNLHDIYGDKYEINNAPFGLGCQSSAEINGMPINFGQMCGLQTPCRPTPKNPEFVQTKKAVVYYDGKIYDGWQLAAQEETIMENKELIDILRKVKSGELSTEEAFALLKGIQEKVIVRTEVVDNTPCHY